MDDIDYRIDWEEKRELYATIEALRQEIEELRKEVAELKAKLAERESEPPYNPLFNRIKPLKEVHNMSERDDDVYTASTYGIYVSDLNGNDSNDDGD